MKRIGWLLLVFLAAADRPTPSSLDKIAAEVANWVADDEPVAIHVTARAPALASLAGIVGDLVATRAGAGRVDTARAARAEGYAHFVEIELTADATDLRILGRIYRVGHDLWAETAGEKPGGTIGTFVVGSKLDADLRAYLAAPAAVVPAVAPVAPARPRKLAFRAVGSIDLLDLAAADLDGDGKAELVALTPDDVAVLTLGPDGARMTARAPLEGPPPVPRPRTPVGALVVADLDGRRAIVVHSSAHAAGGIFTFAGGTLSRAGDEKAFPVCGDAGKVTTVDLVPGLALFGKERSVATRCGAGLVAVLDTQGVLHLWKPDAKTPYAQVPASGTAFAIADLDGDGKPELVTAAFRAPGGADAFTIYSLAEGAPRVFRKGPTTPAGIVAVTTGDLDGDGAPDVVGASRGAGTQVDLWLAD